MIQVKNLKKAFGKKVIFENVSMDFEYGHIYGFVGINGIGKSVFFRTMSGLIKPTSGEIICNNKILGKDIDYLEDLGYMDNNANFVKDLTGFENLKLLASVKSIIDDDKIIKLMDSFGLDASSNTKVKNYSLGMYQKLSIIQAIMENPKIIIFDEPFNGLDKKSCAYVKTMIQNLKSENKLILITSHILNDIGEVADVVYEFDNQTIKRA